MGIDIKKLSLPFPEMETLIKVTRESIAKDAMCALLSTGHTVPAAVQKGIQAADLLLEELNKGKEVR